MVIEAHPQRKPPAGKYPFDHRAALRHLRRADPRLADLIARVGHFRLPLDNHPSPYHALFEAILYQQLHGSAAAAILNRVKQQIGSGDFPHPGALLAAGDDDLRACGLSRQKIAALRDLAQHTAAGNVPSLDQIAKLRDDEIVARLTAVRGVGVWTVHMLLIFRLGRPDVLPTLDYGVRHGFQLAYRKRKMPTPQQIQSHGARWAPYRSVASWYLWQAVALEKKEKKGKKEKKRS